MQKTVQKQEWENCTRYIILNKYGSIIVDLYKKPQRWWDNSTQVSTTWVWGLYIVPKYRMKGYAKEFLREAEQLVFSKGHKAIFMAYHKDSTPKWVLDFYIREGYKIVEKDKSEFMLYKLIQKGFQA